MKQSNKPSVRIKRAIKELSEQNNCVDIGNAIFEEIIRKGINQQKLAIEEAKKQKVSHFISPFMFEEAIEIIEKHLNL